MKNEQLSPLSASDTQEFKTRHAKAIESLTKSADYWREFTVEYSAICKRELWRAEHKTKEEFVESIRQEIGVSRSQFFKKVYAEEVRKKLKSQSETRNVKSLAKVVDSMSTEALLEVGNLPPEERIDIVAEVAKNGKVTAPAIAAKASAPKAEKSAVEKDSTGTKIPAPALPYWERRNEVQPWLNQISAIKCAIEKALKEQDPLFAWIGNPAIDFLSSAYAAISNAKLYAVCTDCQGWGEKKGGCATCHNTGLISKHHYDVCSRREIKELRERANALRA